MKIGVKEIMSVVPGSPRAVPLLNPKQPDTVGVLCCYVNRRNPELSHKYGIKREPENGLFWIIATEKK